MVFDDLLGDVESQTGAAGGLLGCEIRIENLVQLSRRDAGPVVFDAKIDVKIFLGAPDCDNSLFFRASLDGIDEDVLNGAIKLQGVS